MVCTQIYGTEMDEESLKRCFYRRFKLWWKFMLKKCLWGDAKHILTLLFFRFFFMKKMSVCFGLGLNFASMSHQVMSSASKWFSAWRGEGIWQVLGLHPLSCWFKGRLRFAFLSAPLHTHTYTHFTLTFSSKCVVHVQCYCCVADTGAGAAAGMQQLQLRQLSRC